MIARTKLVLRESYTRKDGSHPIYLRVIINRKTKYFSLGVFCLETHWLEDKEEISSSAKNCTNNNLKLADAARRATSIINDFTRFNKPPTFTEFTNKFRGNFSKDSFYAYAQSYIAKHNDLSNETRRTYKSQLTKLDNYTNVKKLILADINNLDFIQGYKNYMHSELKNKTNTMAILV